jgi:hypothetical protein
MIAVGDYVCTYDPKRRGDCYSPSGCSTSPAFGNLDSDEIHSTLTQKLFLISAGKRAQHDDWNRTRKGIGLQSVQYFPS